MAGKVKKERWYSPTRHTGWQKSQTATERRRRSLRAHKGDKLSTARALQALANVTTDKQTKKLARADAAYFYDLYRRGK